MLNHAGLCCDSMAAMSKALSSIPSAIKSIIYCGQLGVVVQTCNPVLRAMLRPGTESRVTEFEAIKKIVFFCANIHSFTSGL